MTMILEIKTITAIHRGNQANQRHDWKSCKSGNPNHGNQANHHLDLKDKLDYSDFENRGNRVIHHGNQSR